MGVGEALEVRNREIQLMTVRLNDALAQISKLENEIAALTAKNKVPSFFQLVF